MLPVAPTWIEVDLGAIRHNVQVVRALLPSRVGLVGVVKANAYGHGALPVARAVLAAGADALAVARAEEGLALRAEQIPGPIWVLGYVPPSAAEMCVAADLTVTVNHPHQAEALAAAVRRLGGPARPVHLKVDTGLGRYGLLPDEILPLASHIATYPELTLQALWTHLSVSEEPNHPYTQRQMEAFTQARRALEAEGLAPPLYHCANSGAVLRGEIPMEHFTTVRVGVTLYGLDPEPGVTGHPALRPALAWKSRVARLHTLQPGMSVSYGCTYTASAPTRVALIPVGYGDGFPRVLGNERSAVLIQGQRCPVVGRVCMDNIVVNVNHLAQVAEEDEVVLIGSQGNDRISAEEMACWQGTNNYEVVTRLLPRPPRLYAD